MDSAVSNIDFEKVTEVFRKLVDAIVELARKVAKVFTNVIRKFLSYVLRNTNPKSYHYYTHCKKYRVRKKHYNRLVKELVYER